MLGPVLNRDTGGLDSGDNRGRWFASSDVVLSRLDPSCLARRVLARVSSAVDSDTDSDVGGDSDGAGGTDVVSLQCSSEQ